VNTAPAATRWNWLNWPFLEHRGRQCRLFEVMMALSNLDWLVEETTKAGGRRHTAGEGIRITHEFESCNRCRGGTVA
jgi:hypothetical protein